MNRQQPMAIVTGGANGIGWATAQQLAEQGYRVAIADLQAEAARQRAHEPGAGHAGIGVDVAAEAQVTARVKTVVAQFGQLDVLVNNGGVGDQPHPTIHHSVDAFDRLLGIHLRGALVACREAGKVMLAQRSGAIVNLCSIAGLAGIPARNAYGAAEADGPPS